jgi:hypothetical protein
VASHFAPRESALRRAAHAHVKVAVAVGAAAGAGLTELFRLLGV